MASAPTTIEAATESAAAGAGAVQVRLATNRDEPLVPSLCRLLQDAVASGASVGFLGPLALPAALRYWRTVFDSPTRSLRLWLAIQDGEVIGAVQLAPCSNENGRHRAELRKLLVLRSHRRQGIARRLLRTVDDYAAHHALTLLYLDTIAGSEAETLYRYLGWSRTGEIPDYAAMPDGELRPTAIWYKKIPARAY